MEIRRADSGVRRRLEALTRLLETHHPTEGGGTLVIQATTPNSHGPGHEAVLQERGIDASLLQAVPKRTRFPSLSFRMACSPQGSFFGGCVNSTPLALSSS